ncbi:hypothetical protein ACNOYE_24595 [Nannocystaceae bacterium ST9]
MSAERSQLARWLPTMLGVGAALTVAVLYEVGVLGSKPPAPAEEPCCAETREAPPEPGPILIDRPHPSVEVEREQLVEQLEQAQTREQLLAEQALAGEVRFTNLSQAELEAMARNCDVRTDYPVRLAPEDLDDLDLAPDEQAAYDRALVRFAEQENALYRELYRELAPPGTDVDALSATELRTKLTRSLGRGKQPGDEDIRKAIAEERAGLRERPREGEGSVYARYTRARFAAGDRFAALLEAELGEERTNELRSAFDGWKGARMREFECPKSE